MRLGVALDPVDETLLTTFLVHQSVIQELTETRDVALGGRIRRDDTEHATNRHVSNAVVKQHNRFRTDQTGCIECCIILHCQCVNLPTVQACNSMP